MAAMNVQVSRGPVRLFSGHQLATGARGRTCQGRRLSAIRAEAVDTSTMKDGVRCYMTAEGALVCEKLEPGNYRLEAAAPRTHDENGALKDAPVCDPTRPQDCLTYCYVMEDGSMVCEGLPSGEYEIKSAGPEDIEKMVVHAMALQKGATYKDVSPVVAEEPAKEEGGILGKLTGFFRST